MTSDELVHALVADLRPVRRLRAVGARAALWAGLAVGCVALGALALGPRPDLVEKLHDPAFLVESAALLVAFAAAARSAFHLGVPGAERRPLVRAVPLAGLLAWVVLVATRGAWAGAGDGWPCVWRMAGLGLAPALAIVLMLRRAAPRARAWSGGLALLSVSALAVLGTQAVCVKDDPAHLLAWHVAPVLWVALAGAGAGRWLLGRGA